MLPQDGVRPGRVDDAHFPQEIGRSAQQAHILLDELGGARRPVRQDVDPIGRRRRPLRQERLAEQRVDQRRLAAVELADDDQQEELVELLQGPAQVFDIGRRRFPARQHIESALQDSSLLGLDALLRFVEERHQGHRPIF